MIVVVVGDDRSDPVFNEIESVKSKTFFFLVIFMYTSFFARLNKTKYVTNKQSMNRSRRKYYTFFIQYLDGCNLTLIHT